MQPQNALFLVKMAKIVNVQVMKSVMEAPNATTENPSSAGSLGLMLQINAPKLARAETHLCVVMASPALQ